MDEEKARDRPRRRRRLVLFTLVVFAIVEGAAWAGDAIWGYRDRLLSVLDAVEVHHEPVAAVQEMEFLGRGLKIRSPEDRPPTRPYVVGGRVVPGGSAVGKQIYVEPEDVVRPDRKRVFIVGGSAAFGSYYPYGRTLAGLLDRLLDGSGRDVVNAAQPGFPSGRVVGMVRQILDHYEPETIVVFTGNNEWIYWAPRTQAWAGSGRGGILRFLAHSRLLALVEYPFVKRAVERQEKTRQQAPGYAIHRELTGVGFALEHPYEEFEPYDHSWWTSTRQDFLDTFRENLAVIVRLCRERDVRVVLLTVPFAYRLSPCWKHPQPLASDPSRRQMVEAACRRAAGLLGDRQPGAALDVVREAARQERFSPVLHYLEALCLERLGRPAEAESSYASARDNMIGNLGGCLAINAAISEVAQSLDVPLVDVRRLFDERQHARGGYFNADLIHDDCHATPEGHEIIALALKDALGL